MPCVHFPQITIFITHDQLPSDLVVQLVEQQWSVPEIEVLNPTKVTDFFSLSVWAHFFSRAIDQKVLFCDTYTVLQWHFDFRRLLAKLLHKKKLFSMT